MQQKCSETIAWISQMYAIQVASYPLLLTALIIKWFLFLPAQELSAIKAL